MLNMNTGLRKLDESDKKINVGLVGVGKWAGNCNSGV